jgi:uncharacterized membrane protein YedE/YeeE
MTSGKASPRRGHRIVTPIEKLESAWPDSGIATVAGRVVRFLGRGDGALIALDDGTASLEVWVPRNLDPCGDVSLSAHLELDVRPGLLGQDFADARAIAMAVRSPKAVIRRQMTRLGQALVLAIAITVAAVRFLAIDSTSQSASDTLRPWLIQAGLIALIAGGLIFLIQQYESLGHRRG